MKLHLARIPNAQRLLLLGSILAVSAAMIVWMLAAGGGSQAVTAGATDGGAITSRESAALRGVQFASTQDGIEAENVFVGEMTRAQYTRSRGGELGEGIAGRDAPVWVVVVEPTRSITKTDLGRTSTYALYEIAFNKATGRRVGSSYYYEGIQPAISMSPATRVQVPAQ